MEENERTEAATATAPTLDKMTEEGLADERKSSAGKDRKITELSEALKVLRGEKEVAVEAMTSEGADLVTAARQLSEKIGRADALTESLQEREAALNWAIENKAPIRMTVGNSHRLPEFQAEVQELADSIADGMRAGSKVQYYTGVPQTGGGQAARTGGRSAPRPQSYGGSVTVLPEGDGLTIANMKDMTPSEVSLIPSSIFLALQEGAR